MLACHDFLEEGVTIKILTEARVIRLGDVVVDLHKIVSKLETNVTPSTTCEVLEAHQKEVTKNV